jgi:excisionase family DNA binding protein
MGKKISLDEAAEELGTSLRTVRRLVSQGHLRAYKIGNSRLVRVDRDDIQAALKPVTPNGKD